MSIEEKVGQLCSPILQSSDIPGYLRNFVEDIGVGVIRYCINAEYDNASRVVGKPNRYLSPSENAELLNNLQKLACGRKNGIPLIFSIDQEGGTRNDLNRYGALVYGSHMAFGAADDPELTNRVAYHSGLQMKALGINLVQAPITDVISFAGRTTIKAASFGEDPELVTKHSFAMMEGYQKAGIAVMIKHFPGYGATAVDAHKGMARVTKSKAELDCHDNIPLKTLLQKGADGVMTGHVVIESLDPSGLPATLSQKIIEGLLREEWGYDGIVESDALRMKAIQEKFGTAKAAVMSIQAGCDVILLRGPEQHFIEGYEAVLEAARRGEISRERIDKSLGRIFRLKMKLGLFEKPFTDAEKAEEAFKSKEARKAAIEIASNSVTLIRDTVNLLPLSAKGKCVAVISPEPSKIAGAMDPVQSSDMLADAVKKIHHDIKDYLVPQEITDEVIAKAVETARSSDMVILGTANAINSRDQVKLARAIIALGKPTVLIALESPFDALEIPEASTVICTMGFSADAMSVAAEAIFGLCIPTGKLPVAFPEGK